MSDSDLPKEHSEYEARRCSLYWALRSRVLTDEELRQVEEFDYGLTIQMRIPYNEQEKREEFNRALLQQFKLRLAAVAARSSGQREENLLFCESEARADALLAAGNKMAWHYRELAKLMGGDCDVEPPSIKEWEKLTKGEIK